MVADDISRYRPASREKRVQPRHLLREWDPIGVYGPGSSCPPDEYDWLLGIVGQLRGGMSCDQLETFLEDESRNRFGMSPPADTSEFAAKVYPWYWAEPLWARPRPKNPQGGDRRRGLATDECQVYGHVPGSPILS